MSKEKRSPLDKVYIKRSNLKKQIEEIRAEIRQLENNLEFINSDDTSNPLIVSVLKNIDKKKTELSKLQEQLKKLNVERNKIQKKQDETEAVNQTEPEEEESEE
jgi:chromosome segregation ATPase